MIFGTIIKEAVANNEWLLEECHVLLSLACFGGLLHVFLLLLVARRPVGVEAAPEGLPAPVVRLVQLLAGLQAPFGDRHAEGRLEHERLGGTKRANVTWEGCGVAGCPARSDSVYHGSFGHALRLQLG